jgi:hypothetical protein
LKLQKKELKFLSALYSAGALVLLLLRNLSSEYQDMSVHYKVTRLVLTIILVQLLKRIKINSKRTLNIINYSYLIGISLMIVQNIAETVEKQG